MGHPVLIEAALLDPVLNELRELSHRRPPKLVAEAPKLSKAAGTRPRSCLLGICLPPLFRAEAPSPKGYKRMEVVSTASCCLQHLLLCKDPLIAAFSPFIYCEHGYPVCFHRHQPSTHLRSSSYANEQSLSYQQPTQSCHSRVPQRLQLYFTTAGGWLKLSLQRLSNAINVLQHHCDIHGRRYVQHVSRRELNPWRRLVPVVPII